MKIKAKSTFSHNLGGAKGVRHIIRVHFIATLTPLPHCHFSPQTLQVAFMVLCVHACGFRLGAPFPLPPDFDLVSE